MKNSGNFRVSLHCSHPRLSGEEIAASFGLQPKYVRSVGARRVTKLGEDLGGVYVQSDVSFLVSDGVLSNDDVLVAEYLDEAVDRLPLDMIDNVVSSGGSCFFFIGIYSSANILCDLDANLLMRLAAHNIGLKLDFYDGPEE